MSIITPTMQERYGADFDALRREDERGEFWSARDLMPALGYGADWRNFAAAIDRARATAVNQDSSRTPFSVASPRRPGAARARTTGSRASRPTSSR